MILVAIYEERIKSWKIVTTASMVSSMQVGGSYSSSKKFIHSLKSPKFWLMCHKISQFEIKTKIHKNYIFRPSSLTIGTNINVSFNVVYFKWFYFIFNSHHYLAEGRRRYWLERAVAWEWFCKTRFFRFKIENLISAINQQRTIVTLTVH